MGERINSLESDEFVHLFCSVAFKDLVATRLMSYTPFESIEDIIASLFEVIENLSTDIKVSILVAIPQMLDESARLGPESTREHRAAGMMSLEPEVRDRIRKLNREYRDKFGFSFVICARENKAPSIIAGLNRRLLNTREEEIENGIEEVKKIARLRALDVLKSLAP